MKAVEIIEEAILEAKSKGLKITVGGCLFDWTGENGSLKGCNCLGAVLLKNGLENLAGPVNGFDKHWLKTLSKILGEPPFWIARFLLGFDLGTQIVLITLEKGEEKSREEDAVSKLALKLHKKLLGKG